MPALPLIYDLPYLNEAFMLASGICLATGWYFIRRRRIEVHRALMLSASWLGGAFFVSYVLRTFLIGDTTFGGPAALKLPYLIFLQIHATLATVAGVLGIITLRRALRGQFARHRRIAPWTATLWLVAVVSGFIVFLMLYVVFPPGPTTNLFRAIGA